MLQEIVVVQSAAYRKKTKIFRIGNSIPKRIMKKCIEFKAEIEAAWVLN